MPILELLTLVYQQLSMMQTQKVRYKIPLSILSNPEVNLVHRISQGSNYYRSHLGLAASIGNL